MARSSNDPQSRSELLRFLGGGLSTKPKCVNHPQEDAVGTCTSCLKTICEVCSVPGDKGVRCARCVRNARLRRVAALAVSPLVAAALVAGAFFALRRPPPAPPQPPPVVAKDPLVEALEKEPCDRRAMLELARQLMRAHENRDAIDRSNAFLERCGTDTQLRSLMYTAHSYLSDWDGAIAEATKLLEQAPNDASYYAWRGVAQEKRGDLKAAVADFQQALAIEPKMGGIPFNLADDFERLGTPCEAIGPLEQYIHFNPGDAASAAGRLEQLGRKVHCDDLEGSGKATVHFAPRANVIPAVVKINGHAGVFLVDTGASMVAMSAAYAKSIGIAYEAWPTMLVATAAGVRRVRTGKVTVELQGVKASHVDAAVVDDMAGMQGLLGISFLSRFDVKIDAQKGVLEVSAREPAKK